MAVFIADLNTKKGMQETGAGDTDVPAWLAQATIICLGLLKDGEERDRIGSSLCN